MFIVYTVLTGEGVAGKSFELFVPSTYGASMELIWFIHLGTEALGHLKTESSAS